MRQRRRCVAYKGDSCLNSLFPCPSVFFTLTRITGLSHFCYSSEPPAVCIRTDVYENEKAYSSIGFISYLFFSMGTRTRFRASSALSGGWMYIYCFPLSPSKDNRYTHRASTCPLNPGRFMLAALGNYILFNF